MKMRLSALLGALAVLALGVAANATMVLPSSLAQMVSGSDTIVTGRVLSQNSYVEGKTIYTAVNVGEVKYLKAADPARPASITLKVLGGAAQGTVMRVDMAPAFEDGEEVLLFLKRSGDKYITYGFYYGVVRIKVSGDGLSYSVTGPLFQTGEVYDFKTKTKMNNDLPLGGEPLDSLKARIANAITLQDKEK